MSYGVHKVSPSNCLGRTFGRTHTWTVDITKSLLALPVNKICINHASDKYGVELCLILSDISWNVCTMKSNQWCFHDIKDNMYMYTSKCIFQNVECLSFIYMCSAGTLHLRGNCLIRAGWPVWCLAREHPMLLWGYRALSHATAASEGGGGHVAGPGVWKSVYLWSCKEVDVFYIAKIGSDI